MSDLRFFTVVGGTVHEQPGAAFKSERELQALFEANLETLLGVRLVASEFSTGNGRIDTLGIDENNFPVVIEYKLDKNKTVINQGMSYMAWLKSHKTDFWKTVFDKQGREAADAIDHSSPRLICIASDFTREDLGAYELMPNSIDLIRYRRFGESQILLERVRSVTDDLAPVPAQPQSRTGTDKPLSQVLQEMPESTRNLFEEVRKAIVSQGEDVTEKMTKLYVAFKRIRNFATLTNASKTDLNLYLHLDPDTIQMAENMRDVRSIGHWGTGDLEVRIRNFDDIERAKPLINRAYEGQA